MLTTIVPYFGGSDYVHERDAPRLQPQMERVKSLMADGEWLNREAVRGKWAVRVPDGRKRMTVWKYTLGDNTEQEILMPNGAELLHVDRQGNALRLWARVDPKAPVVHRSIRIVGTGWSSEGEDAAHGQYVGTAQLGPFVWHVFDQGEK